MKVNLENKVTGELFTTINIPSRTMKDIRRVSKKKGISVGDYIEMCIRNGLRIMEMRERPYIIFEPFISVRGW